MTAGLGAPEVRTAVQGLLTATVRVAIAMSTRDDNEKTRKRSSCLSQLQNLQIFQKGDNNSNRKRMESHAETLQRVQQFWAVVVAILEWCAPSNGKLIKQVLLPPIL
jgi:hypothetical protein